MPGGGDDPHRGQPVLHHGPPPSAARAVVILVHGRGDSAAGILSLTGELAADDVAWVAPQAAGRSWYPHSFLMPAERNEPALSSALGVIGSLVQRLQDHDGVPPAHIVLMGFSQGACLVSEFAVRHARRYGGVIVLSGGLIGAPGTPRDYAGSFDGTPALFGCSDVDPHIPLTRVNESIEIYRRLGAIVDDRIYPNLPHTIINDELEAVDALLRAIPERQDPGGATA